MNKLEDCMTRLSTAMQKFTVRIWTNDAQEFGLLKLWFLQFMTSVAPPLKAKSTSAYAIWRTKPMTRTKRWRILTRRWKILTVRWKILTTRWTIFTNTWSAASDRPRHRIQSLVKMSLKPEVFYGRDDFVEVITLLLLQEETSRVCILGPGGMGKTSVSLAVVESPLIKERFPDGNFVWVPCIEATSTLLEILYIQLQILGDKQVTLEKIISVETTAPYPARQLRNTMECAWRNSETGWRHSS